MIILHNIHDKASRAFVAANGSQPGVTVLDWYNQTDRNAWLAAGGTLGISAFPSVLLRHDTYVADGTTVEAGWDVLRTPSGIDPLPAVGQPVPVGLYTYNGAYLICRQAHTRLARTPNATPALFSVWRADTPDMIWIANELVQAGNERIYNGVRYRAIQPHTTQVDWRPDVTPALWQVAEVEPTVPAWTAGVYTLNALVTRNSRTWKSLVANNAYEPGAVGTWRDQSNPPMWVQPSGAVGLWQVNDVATHNGQTWRNTSANNSFAPGVFGWVLA